MFIVPGDAPRHSTARFEGIKDLVIVGAGGFSLKIIRFVNGNDSVKASSMAMEGRGPDRLRMKSPSTTLKVVILEYKLYLA